MKFDHKWAHSIKEIVGRFDGGELPIVKLPPHLLKGLKEKPSTRTAAVFVPLCNRHGVPSVLFTVRSSLVGSHKGQVSFPGGHMEPDETAVQAAIRETYEELGSDIGPLHVLGMCQTVPAKTMTPVTPVIGFMEKDVGDFEHFSPSPGEVDRVFCRSLEQLLDPTYSRYEMLSRDEKSPKVRMPIFGWPDENGDKNSVEYEERIWGLTAWILDAVLKQAVVPTHPAAVSKQQEQHHA
jgi:8-oxo-dGTP pyrophosphatase MutT (NUDIX family)